MKRRLFGLIAALVGVVLSLAAVEAMAVVWTMLENDGRYVPVEKLFERTQNAYIRDMTRGSSCRYIDSLYPHPYVAFVHHGNEPCGRSNANNVGMLGADYPTMRRPDRFTILLTGGSIASQLAQIAPPPAPRFLEDELNRNYRSPNGQPFEVLNGGDGAWKQPQPFILFALHAQAFDAVVALGGTNEFYLFRDFVTERLEWPEGNFLQVNPLVADENFGDAAIGWVMGRVAGTLSQSPMLGRSHAVYMIVRGVESLAKGRGGLRSSKRTTIDSLFALPADTRGRGEAIWAIQLELFQKYVRGMRAIADDNGAKSAFFFHAVPAHGKTLTPEERAAAGDLSYAKQFRRMVDDMMQLRSRGLQMFDLGDLLVNVKETIYADDSHFIVDPRSGESPGYRLMATRVAADLAQAWSLERKQ